MSKTIEYELDAAHRVMIEEMTDEDTDAEEFVSQMLDQTIYNTYQQFKDAKKQQGGQPDAEDVIQEAEPAE